MTKSKRRRAAIVTPDNKLVRLLPRGVKGYSVNGETVYVINRKNAERKYIKSLAIKIEYGT
jgi:hypothetical protein